MRDIHQLVGKKIRVEDFEQAILLVRKSHPNAMAEGSVGCWHFHKDGNIVAEMWLHRDRGWWLRIGESS